MGQGRAARGVAGAAVLALVAAVAGGCARTGTGGWRGVPLGDVRVTTIDDHPDGAIIGGTAARGGAVVRLVSPDGRVHETPVRGGDRVWSLKDLGGALAVVDDADRTTAPVLWVVDGAFSEPVDLPTTADDRAPARLWITDGDDTQGMVGGFVEDDQLVLRPLSYADAVGTFLDGPAQVVLAHGASEDELLVGGTEGFHVVAGPVTDTPGDAASWAAFATSDEEHDWQPLPLDPRPDGLTDVDASALDVVLAGHADGRPVLLDAGVGPLPVPDVALDPDAPIVVVAELSIGRDASLAIQTVDGPVLFLASGAGEWTELPLPTGVLRDAVVAHPLDGMRTAFVLVDDTLWVRGLADRP